MNKKDKYTLISYRNNEVTHPDYMELTKDINVEDLVTFYYYFLYPNHMYEGESHDYYEFFVCLGGKAKVVFEDRVVYLKEKEFLITPPNLKHSHNPEKTFLSSVSISFSATGLQESIICNKVGRINDEELNILNLLINEYINNYDYQSQYEQPYVKKVDLKNEYAYKQMFKCALEILLVLITRQFQNDDAEQKVDVLKGQRESENEIIQYIKEHYQEKILLKDIASTFNYSVGHLCRKFKQETGDTLVDYITKYRISVAMRLLFERKDLSTEEIALEVGFNDVQYFTKSFKKCVGNTPGKYRAEINRTSALHAQDVLYDVIKNIK
jgi:AraC-like DNA-binding protein/mannose-6-phosphate isomerase-like protein (cupin superfamily)